MQTVIRTSILMASVVLLLANVGCKKDSKTNDPYSCTTCIKTPEANAAHDASSKGIYKGVVIGSTGVIKFNIANNSNDISAVLIIDGVTVNLTSSVSWQSGQPYVAPFTGTLNGSPVSITFSVGLSGGTPTVTSATIPGHPNAVFNIVKEPSSALIECFEGTYNTTRPESGTFNLIVARSLGLFSGIARENGTNDLDDIDGTVNAQGQAFDSNGRNIANINGDELSGSFTDSNGNRVTVTGRRTL